MVSDCMFRIPTYLSIIKPHFKANWLNLLMHQQPTPTNGVPPSPYLASLHHHQIKGENWLGAY